MLGGPVETAASMQPWAEAIYAADSDPVRTGYRRLIYAGVQPTQEQVDAITQGVDLTTLSPRTLSWLSSTYAFAGAHKQADRIIRDALRRHPSDIMLNFDYGYGLAVQGRWQEAIRMYSRALAIRPDVAGIWHIMGLALEEVDELENAREALARACELEDDYGPSWVSLGNVLLKQNRSSEALVAGRRAIVLIPDQPAGHGIIGRALMQQNNYQDALPALEKCDRLGKVAPQWKSPSSEWLKECRRRLE